MPQLGFSRPSFGAVGSPLEKHLSHGMRGVLFLFQSRYVFRTGPALSGLLLFPARALLFPRRSKLPLTSGTEIKHAACCSAFLPCPSPSGSLSILVFLYHLFPTPLSEGNFVELRLDKSSSSLPLWTGTDSSPFSTTCKLEGIRTSFLPEGNSCGVPSQKRSM